MNIGRVKMTRKNTACWMDMNTENAWNLPKSIFSKRVRVGRVNDMGWYLLGGEDQVDDGECKWLRSNSGEVISSLPWVVPEGHYLQQYNAPMHSATRDVFTAEGIKDIARPTKSPDMNCIENACGEICRNLNDGGRQFDTTENLKEALSYKWDILDMIYIRGLIRAIPGLVDELRRNVVRKLDTSLHIIKKWIRFVIVNKIVSCDAIVRYSNSSRVRSRCHVKLPREREGTREILLCYVRAMPSMLCCSEVVARASFGPLWGLWKIWQGVYSRARTSCDCFE